jgi:hypothetical protein
MTVLFTNGVSPNAWEVSGSQRRFIDKTEYDVRVAAGEKIVIKPLPRTHWMWANTWVVAPGGIS